MIPFTYPTVIDSSTGMAQCAVSFLSDITGLVEWVDYIPVKSASYDQALANTTNAGGFQLTYTLPSLVGQVGWIDYIPVYEYAGGTIPFSTDAGGYIPVSSIIGSLLQEDGFNLLLESGDDTLTEG